MIDIIAAFDKFSVEGEDEYLHFERIAVPLSKRPDLHAFLMLDAMLPGAKRNMVCASAHDEFYLDVGLEKLAAVATEEQIRDLVRCGVILNSDTESLSMFT